MPKGFRDRKKPSKGDLERRLADALDENDVLHEALQAIADILEDVGILDAPEEEEEEDDPEPEIIEGDPSNLIIEEENSDDSREIS